MKKTIKIIDCYNIFKKYGNLDINVNTPYGYKKILDCDVTAKNSQFITIETENDKKLTCSPNHRIRVSNGKFVAVNDLILGKSKIMTVDGVSKLKSINIISGTKDLFDIQVNGIEQYYSNGIVSHNSTILKSMSYVAFGKTLETETRTKFGDMRFVNNRNGATSCEGYMILEANGEYYGIKRKTEIIKNKSGEITGAPTTLKYYLLSNPDEEMDEKTSLDTLIEDRRVKTQKKIDTIIGSYDNFMRIVMTTSDTLNRILSNDMAVFIDSILFDSGCDIFDKKLEGLKVYQKRLNEKSRVNCNVELVERENINLFENIDTLKKEIFNIETINLPDVQTKINKGRKYVEDLTKKLFKIDPEIYNLDVVATRDVMALHIVVIDDLKAHQGVLKTSIDSLRETYDEEKLKNLIEKKDVHKANEYSQKLIIKEREQTKVTHDHSIEILNGDVVRLKESGLKYKDQILELKKSKTCPTCGQLLTAEHQTHINDKITSIEALMFPIASQINDIQNVKVKEHQVAIKSIDIEIETIKKGIQNQSLEMETILTEIGTLNNEKNDVEKRKELQNEYNTIPTKIQNEELRISIHQQKIDNHDNSVKQIEENHKIEKGIGLAKLKLSELEIEEADERENVYIKKTSIAEKELKVKNNQILVTEFKVQEHRDLITNLYKQCVHRDGIPRQMLSNYILPKINITLENILSIAPFKVWLDSNDLRPKLAYNDRPNSIIDCISASGKERTFSSIVLKFALNQINVKAKPTIFLLDEVMGKLDEESTEEFIEILQLIKKSMKKVLVIEHIREISPDYVLSVQLNDEGISSVTME